MLIASDAMKVPRYTVATAKGRRYAAMKSVSSGFGCRAGGIAKRKRRRSWWFILDGCGRGQGAAECLHQQAREGRSTLRCAARHSVVGETMHSVDHHDCQPGASAIDRCQEEIAEVSTRSAF